MISFFASSQLRAVGTVPMCSTQMERIFNTTRIPGIETGEELLRSVQFKRYTNPQTHRADGTCCPGLKLDVTACVFYEVLKVKYAALTSLNQSNVFQY